MALTKKAIDGFEYQGNVTVKDGREVHGWDVRWDKAQLATKDIPIPGFGVRVYPSGVKAFVLRYRARGRKRLMVLGSYGSELTLTEARAKARKTRNETRDGADPVEERRRESQGKTFGDLIVTFLKNKATRGKKTVGDDEKRLNLHIPKSWRARPADSITRAEVTRLHGRIGETAPYQANRILANLHAMFRKGQVWGHLPENAVNPAGEIDKFPEKKRKRWGKPEEVAAIARAIDTEPSVYIRGALWLYFLTGARKNELLEAKRADVDWTRGQLKLPDPKSGEEQQLTLSAPALAILQALPAEDKNPYLFPAAKKGTKAHNGGHHLVNINKPWQRVRDRATVILWAEANAEVFELVGELGRDAKVADVQSAAQERGLELQGDIRDLRLHDIRRTVGSWLSQSSVELNTIREGLRHADLSTTIIYTQLGADPAREAFEQHGQRLLEVTGRTGPVEVAGGDRND